MRLYLICTLFITTSLVFAQSGLQSVDGEPGALNNCAAKHDLLNLQNKKVDLRLYFLRKVDESQSNWNILNEMSLVSGSLVESKNSTHSASSSEITDYMSYLIYNSKSISSLTTSSRVCTTNLQSLLETYSDSFTLQEKEGYFSEVNYKILLLKDCYSQYTQSLIVIIYSLDAEIERLTTEINLIEC
jgi:hypothetical protein